MSGDPERSGGVLTQRDGDEHAGPRVHPDLSARWIAADGLHRQLRRRADDRERRDRAGGNRRRNHGDRRRLGNGSRPRHQWVFHERVQRRRLVRGDIRNDGPRDTGNEHLLGRRHRGGRGRDVGVGGHQLSGGPRNQSGDEHRHRSLGLTGRSRHGRLRIHAGRVRRVGRDHDRPDWRNWRTRPTPRGRSRRVWRVQWRLRCHWRVSARGGRDDRSRWLLL
jgi:hypothetical protein